jgi:hypothetical protein
MTNKILGFWVTEAPDVLEVFIQQAREHYTALEQALEPISTAIADLETYWTPRPADFWQQQTAALAPLRQATKTALQLFAKEQSSQAAPVPRIVAATSIGYRTSLYYLESKIATAGTLLIVHSGGMSCTSLSQSAMKQRQRILQALCEVEEAGRKAIREGRAKLDTAAQEQQKLTAPPPARQPQTEPQRQQQPTTTADTTAATTKARQRPALRIVRVVREDGTAS